MLRAIWCDETGAVFTTELLMVTSVVVAGLATGLTKFRDAVNSEMSDVATAVQDLNQSYRLNGVQGHSAMTPGSDYVDTFDPSSDAYACTQIYR